MATQQLEQSSEERGTFQILKLESWKEHPLSSHLIKLSPQNQKLGMNHRNPTVIQDGPL
jgi:hypothetical protein